MSPILTPRALTKINRILKLLVMVTCLTVSLFGKTHPKNSAKSPPGHTETTPHRAKTEVPPRYDSPEAAAKYYLQRRLPPGSKRLPVESFFTAREHMARMPKHSPGVTNVSGASPAGASPVLQQGLDVWQPLGPGNIGGRTRAFLIDSANPNIMYSAGVAGGVWKSTDAGDSWHPIGDLLPSLAVSTLAMSPADHNVLYAGTGEGFFNYDAVRGAGIFKSSDGGVTWFQSSPLG